MNTGIKTGLPMISLAILAALLTMRLGSVAPAWAESPISPISPLLPPRPAPPYEDGNYACWQRCISENPDRVEGFCLCKCGVEDNGTCSNDQVSAAAPPPVQQACPGWWEELNPWMGMYVLRTNGIEYCIGPKVN